jgi:hypothetical protein
MHPQNHVVYEHMIVRSAGLCEFTGKNVNEKVNNWKD